MFFGVSFQIKSLLHKCIKISILELQLFSVIPSRIKKKWQEVKFQISCDNTI